MITWLNRGTLHLVAREDYPWLHALTTPQLFTGQRAAARRRKASHPDEAERAVAVIERSLADEGPLDPASNSGSASLPPAFAYEGPGPAPPASRSPAFAASRSAARWPAGEQAYVLCRGLARTQTPPDRPCTGALAELARRYLVGHAPGESTADLARVGRPSATRAARAGLSSDRPRAP